MATSTSISKNREFAIWYYLYMYIKVRVVAGSKKEEVILEKPNYFKIFVREKAKQNMANKRILEIIAREYGLVSGKVRIVSGHHSPSKLLSVDVEKTVTK